MATSKDLGVKLTAERTAAIAWFDSFKNAAGELDMPAEKVGEMGTRNAALAALQKEYDDALIADKSAAENAIKLMPRVGIESETKDTPDPVTTKAAAEKAFLKSYADNRETLHAMAEGKLANGSVHFPLAADLKTVLTTGDYTSQASRLQTTGSALYYGDVENLFQHGTTTAKNIEYYIQTTDTNNAAATAEGVAVTDSAFSYTLTTDEVETVQAWIPVTRESLSDDQFTMSLVSSRLALELQKVCSQIMLSGTGTTPIPWGVAVRTGVQTQAKGTDPAFDAIHKAIVLVQVTGDSTPDAICMHPTDWQNLRLTRTVDGVYILGNPAAGDEPTLWGLPVRQTIGVLANGAAGTALVGAFGSQAMVVTNGGLSVEISTEHSTYFTERKAAIAMSRRFAVAGFRPNAFAKVTGL
jgi:HK97 family phage major capsid protein